MNFIFSCYSHINPYFLIDDEGYLRWNKTSLENDGYTTSDQLYCTYQEIWRPENDDFNFIYGDKKTFQGENVKLKSDFVYTQCKNWFNFAVYEDFLAFAQKKNDIRTYKVIVLYDFVNSVIFFLSLLHRKYSHANVYIFFS